jgi:hypothetical protein
MFSFKPGITNRGTMQTLQCSVTAGTHQTKGVMHTPEILWTIKWIDGFLNGHQSYFYQERSLLFYTEQPES